MVGSGDELLETEAMKEIESKLSNLRLAGVKGGGRAHFISHSSDDDVFLHTSVQDNTMNISTA